MASDGGNTKDGRKECEGQNDLTHTTLQMTGVRVDRPRRWPVSVRLDKLFVEPAPQSGKTSIR